MRDTQLIQKIVCDIDPYRFPERLDPVERILFATPYFLRICQPNTVKTSRKISAVALRDQRR